jgi:hypothetical protein
MGSLEKAAKALCAHVEGRNDVWDDLSAGDREPYFDIVRVVLLGVREPTPEVVEVGRAKQGDCMGFEAQAAAATFTAMIDAILNEAP